MNTITLSKFLSRYYGLKGENLKKLHHEDIKELFPNIKRSSFEQIDNNPELLYYYDVIMVDDGRHIIPYMTPLKIFDNEEEVLLIEDEKQEIDDNIYDYSKLSIYELKQLLRKSNSSYRNQNNAKRELKSRGIIKKKYNRVKFKNYN